jgi:hypothetical protein
MEELEEAISNVNHLTIVGQKGWFDPDKCAEARHCVFEFARLGADCLFLYKEYAWNDDDEKHFAERIAKVINEYQKRSYGSL